MISSKEMIKKLPILIVLMFGIIATACNRPNNESPKSVTVSILPQKYLIDVLTGGELSVNVMVPVGASPASYEPSPKQMKDLSDSKLYLSIGHLGFENAWLPRFQKNNTDLRIIDLSKGIDLIVDVHNEEEEEHEDGHHHHGTDPHYWMSPKQAKLMLESISSSLIMHDNTLKDLIIKNRDSLNSVLDKLDESFNRELGSLNNRKFIIFHPALTYLARDYDLEQIAMEFEGKEPSPAYLKSIVDRAKSENIRLLFIQEEFDIENARQLSKEIGSELLQIDPLSYDYFDQLNEILEKLKKLDSL